MTSSISTEDRFRAAGARVEPFRPNGKDRDRRGKKGGAKEEKPPPPPLAPIDPTKWTGAAPAREWIVPGWIPRGVVTALYGDGGIGKTLLAQMLMTSTAIGAAWLGLDVNAGRALGVFCEDDDGELWRRQEAINRSLDVGMPDLELMRLLSRLGHDNSLVTFEGSAGDLTTFHDQLRELCGQWRPDLLVLDTAADLYPDNENDRSKVRWFVQTALASLAREFQCGLVLLAHPSASGLATGTGTGGSTAWSNTVRSRLYLETETGDGADPNVRILSRKKANYAAKGGDLRLAWDDGVLSLAGEKQLLAGTALPPWETINAIFDELARAWDAGKPWSPAVQTRSSGRYFPSWARSNHGLVEKQTSRLLTEWMMTGCLANETFDTHSKSTGLKVLRRPDR